MGAYRIGLGREIIREYGRKGFYTYSLFKMKDGFIPILNEAIELGRSFIIPEYQNKRLPLFLLWRGILSVLIQHPEYNYIIGPVSISNYYSKVSKGVIVAFIQHYYFDKELAAFIEPRKKFRVNASILQEAELLLKGTRVTDLSKLRNLTNLETLDLSNTEVRDLAPLARLPLRKLDLSGTKLSSRELAALKELPLAELNLASTQVAGLQFLAGMRLAVLDIEHTPVRDLAPLKGMPLRVLRCRDSRVQDLSPLKGMPLRELTCNGEPGDHQSVLNTLRDLETVNGEPYRRRRGD